MKDSGNPGSSFMRAFESLLDDLGETVDQALLRRQDVGERPVRVRKGEDKVVIEVDVPGAAKTDVRVFSSPGQVRAEWTVRGKRSERSFRVSREVNSGSVSAAVADGVLTITVARVPGRDEEKEVPVL